MFKNKGQRFTYTFESINQQGEQIGSAYDIENPDLKLLVKLIPYQIIHDKHILALKKLQTIRHQNLLKVYYVQESGEGTLLITDQLPNSLSELLHFEYNRKSFTKKAALQLINQISSVYLTLTENQIVLKELKSSTIYISNLSEEKKFQVHGQFELVEQPHGNSEAALNFGFSLQHLFSNIANEDRELQNIIRNLTCFKPSDRISWEQLFLISLQLLEQCNEQDLKKVLSITQPQNRMFQSLIMSQQPSKNYFPTNQSNNQFPFLGFSNNMKTMQSSNTLIQSQTICNSGPAGIQQQSNREQINVAPWDKVKQSVKIPKFKKNNPYLPNNINNTITQPTQSQAVYCSQTVQPTQQESDQFILQKDFEQLSLNQTKQITESENSQEIIQSQGNIQDSNLTQFSQQETDVGTSQQSIFENLNQQFIDNSCQFEKADNRIQIENFKYKDIRRAPVQCVEKIREIERQEKLLKQSQLFQQSQLQEK